MYLSLSIYIYIHTHAHHGPAAPRSFSCTDLVVAGGSRKRPAKRPGRRHPARPGQRGF